MFGKDGPSLLELLHQALCSTERGYDLLAPKFDATPFRTPDEILIPVAEEIRDVDSALDLCCGTGAALRVFRPQCKARLTGLDFSQKMLDQARQRLTDSPGQVAVELVRADMMEPQFQEEFELVTCFGALGHVPLGAERDFLRMVRLALKPGGRFAFVAGNPPPIPSLAGIVLRTFNVIMRVRNALLKPPFIMYYLTFLLPEVESLLIELGFHVEIREGLFAAPFQRYKLVIATRE